MAVEDMVLLEMNGGQKLIILEFFRYVGVGGLAFACDFLTYLGLTEMLGWSYLLANVVGFCLGLTVNYLLSIFWVFRHRSVSCAKKEFVLFAGIGGVNLGLGELLLWGLVAFVGIYHVYAKILMTIIVFLSNFCMRKAMLFHAQVE